MRLLVILGPTASGKSQLALELAEHLGGELLCIDSTTVYREPAIGTAKPSQLDRSRAPHHLLDLVSLRQEFSFAAFRRAALDALEDVLGRGRVPILVGGTHLYLKGLLEGYQLSEVPPDVEFRSLCESRALPDLVAQLAQADPAALGIVDLKNPRRVIRALEVCRAGVLFSETYRRHPLPYSIVRLGLPGHDDDWKERVARRCDAMLEAGWLEEVAELRAQGLEGELRRLRILGYPELLDHLCGFTTLEQSRQQIVTHTLQLGRKQRVWYRREEEVEWLSCSSSERVRRSLEIWSARGGPGDAKKPREPLRN